MMVVLLSGCIPCNCDCPEDPDIIDRPTMVDKLKEDGMDVVKYDYFDKELKYDNSDVFSDKPVENVETYQKKVLGRNGTCNKTHGVYYFKEYDNSTYPNDNLKFMGYYDLALDTWERYNSTHLRILNYTYDTRYDCINWRKYWIRKDAQRVNRNAIVLDSVR